MLITHVDDLKQAGRNIVIPFQIIVHDQQLLDCHQVFRVLPGRRLTVLGNLDNQPVVAKFFFDPWSYQRHGKRDGRGIHVLMKQNIKTASLIYMGLTAVPGIFVVIVDYVTSAINFRHLWNNAQVDAERVLFLHKIFETMAQMHGSGILHHDVHLDNFLVAEDEIYVIDGSEVHHKKTAINLKQSLENLSWFSIHLGADHDEYIIKALEKYAKMRHWVNVNTALFLQMLQAAKKKHHRACLKKVFRECTAVISRQSLNVVYRIKRTFDDPFLHQMLKKPEKLFLLTDFSYIKRGNSATVGKVTINGVSMVVKRNNIKNGWHAIKRAIQPTRAARAWKNAHLVELLGIKTPTPIAMMEKRMGFVRRQSYYISEFSTGVTLLDFMSKSDVLADDWHTVANNTMELLYKLFNARLSHGDLKASNFLVNPNLTVSLLDLEAIRYHQLTSRLMRAWHKDLQRLLRNWAHQTIVHDYFKKLIEERGFTP